MPRAHRSRAGYDCANGMRGREKSLGNRRSISDVVCDQEVSSIQGHPCPRVTVAVGPLIKRDSLLLALDDDQISSCSTTSVGRLTNVSSRTQNTQGRLTTVLIAQLLSLAVARMDLPSQRQRMIRARFELLSLTAHAKPSIIILFSNVFQVHARSFLLPAAPFVP